VQKEDWKMQDRRKFLLPLITAATALMVSPFASAADTYPGNYTPGAVTDDLTVTGNLIGDSTIVLDTANNSSTFVLTSGTVQNTNSSAAPTVDINGAGTDGTVTLNGGTLKGGGNNVAVNFASLADSQTGTVTVGSSATVQGDIIGGVDNDITISGTMTGDIDFAANGTGDSNNTITLSGGTLIGRSAGVTNDAAGNAAPLLTVNGAGKLASAVTGSTNELFGVTVDSTGSAGTTATVTGALKDVALGVDDSTSGQTVVANISGNLVNANGTSTIDVGTTNAATLNMTGNVGASAANIGTLGVSNSAVATFSAPVYVTATTVAGTATFNDTYEDAGTTTLTSGALKAKSTFKADALTVNAGSLDVDGAVTVDTGAVDVDGGSVRFRSSADVTTGAITVDVGSFRVDGAFTSGGNISVGATTQAQAVFGGAVTSNAGGGTVLVDNGSTATFASNIDGILSVDNTASVMVNGNVTGAVTSDNSSAIHFGTNATSIGGAVTLAAAANSLDVFTNTGKNLAITGAVDGDSAGAGAAIITLNMHDGQDFAGLIGAAGVDLNTTSVNITNANEGFFAAGDYAVISSVTGYANTATAVTIPASTLTTSFTFAETTGAGGGITLTAARNKTFDEFSSVANHKKVGTALEASAVTPAGFQGLTLGQRQLLSGMEQTVNQTSGVATVSVDNAMEQLLPKLSPAAVNVQTQKDSVYTLASRLAALRDDATSYSAAAGNSDSAWLRVIGATSTQKEMSQYSGYDSDSWGMLVGADTDLMSAHKIGFAFGYMDTSVKERLNGSSRSDITSFQFMPYGTVDLGDRVNKGYIDWFAAYAYQNVESARNLAFASYADKVVGEYDGHQFTVKGTWAMDKSLSRNLMLSPFASAMYVFSSYDKYTETGSAALEVNTSSHGMLEVELGLKSVYKPDSGARSKTRFGAHGMLLWAPWNDDLETESSFAVNTATKFITTVEQSKFGVRAGVSSTFEILSNFDLEFRYDFEARKDFASHAGFVEFKYHF